jgi:hypothetical protein
MRVRSGVFIPRWETEEWTLALANRLRQLIPSRQTFTLVDLCTGSGCIPLLLKDFISANIEKEFHGKYGKPNNVARFIGIEKSATAMDVARINLRRSQPPKQRFPDPYYPFLTELTAGLSTSYTAIFNGYRLLHSRVALILLPVILHIFLFLLAPLSIAPSLNTNLLNPYLHPPSPAMITITPFSPSLIVGRPKLW